MADFVAVLKKTLDKYGEPTPEMRTRIYDGARSALAKKLAEYSPPLSADVVGQAEALPGRRHRQRRARLCQERAGRRIRSRSWNTSFPRSTATRTSRAIRASRRKAEPAWPAPPAAKPEPAKPEPIGPRRRPPPRSSRAGRSPRRRSRPPRSSPTMPCRAWMRTRTMTSADVFPNDDEPARPTLSSACVQPSASAAMAG